MSCQSSLMQVHKGTLWPEREQLLCLGFGFLVHLIGSFLVPEIGTWFLHVEAEKSCLKECKI